MQAGWDFTKLLRSCAYIVNCKHVYTYIIYTHTHAYIGTYPKRSFIINYLLSYYVWVHLNQQVHTLTELLLPSLAVLLRKPRLKLVRVADGPGLQHKVNKPNN